MYSYFPLIKTCLIADNIDRFIEELIYPPEPENKNDELVCINKKMDEISETYLKELSKSFTSGLGETCKFVRQSDEDELDEIIFLLRQGYRSEEWTIKKALKLRRVEAHNNLVKWEKYTTIIKLLKSN